MSAFSRIPLVKREPKLTSACTEANLEIICSKLEKGVPLEVICRNNESLPSTRSICDWSDVDPVVASAIARARDIGFDALAVEALCIADTPERGIIRTINADGSEETREEDMLGHRKLRVETRLKLLAKWCPKRYGDNAGNSTNINVAVGVQVLSEERRNELIERRKRALIDE